MTRGLAERQHGVITRSQLLSLGFSSKAIEHRIARGRLHRVWSGVYALGRPHISRRGIWTAAVLACGPDAALSHATAAALWEIRAEPRGAIEVSVPSALVKRHAGIIAHRRSSLLRCDLTFRDGIPVTSPAATLIDLAARLPRRQLEAAINEADKRDLTNPDELRTALETARRRPGVASLRETLDRHTFALTDSELERRFLAIVRHAGLKTPTTGARLNGFKVDFHWAQLGLVVETDGLRYHRTPAQQARDRLRDQAHAAAGLTPLRFTHAQVRYESDHVRATLAAVARRLGESDRRP